MRKIIMLTLLFVFIGYSYVMASTTVGGNITEDTVWDLEGSPYIVESTVQVFEGAKLSIEPGVTINFDWQTALIVGGELVAQGTENSMIMFTSSEADESPGDWNGIKFIDSSVDAQYDNEEYISGSMLKFCIITYSGPGVTCIKSSPFISQCNITYNYSSSHRGGGFHIDNCSNIVITNCKIENNESNRGGGLYIHNSIGKIMYNRIGNNTSVNGGGFWIYDKSPDILYNKIFHNTASANGGGFHTGYLRPLSANIKHNKIFGNTNYAFYRSDVYTSTAEIDCTENWWGTTDTSLIDDSIYDYNDNIELGKVLYEPIATQPYDFSGGSITGTLKNYITLEPIINGSVSCAGGQATTNSTGQYEIENLTPGDYTLTASAPLYHSKTVENVSVQAGQQTTQDFKLEKKTTGAISGQILGGEGLTDIDNITVELSNDTESFSVSSDVDGSFSFNDITHGDYKIRINSDSCWGIPQNIAVNISETTQVTLVGISQSIVDDIRNGWVTQEQLNKAVTYAEAAKDAVISEKDKTIADLNTTIDSMFTQEQLDQAVLTEKERWDQNGDGKYGLPEAIKALQVTSGTDQE